MPKTGSNIYKRKDGRWEGRYQKGRDSVGKIIYGYVYAKTFTELKKRLNDRPKDNQAKPRQQATVAEAAGQWLSVVALTVKQ